VLEIRHTDNGTSGDSAVVSRLPSGAGHSGIVLRFVFSEDPTNLAGNLLVGVRGDSGASGNWVNPARGFGFLKDASQGGAPENVRFHVVDTATVGASVPSGSLGFVTGVDVGYVPGERWSVEVAIAADSSTELRMWNATSGTRPSTPTLTTPARIPNANSDRWTIAAGVNENSSSVMLVDDFSVSLLQ
jgi:hypothetical protein